MQVETVEYRVNWKKFRPGYSFFVPCINADKAREEITAFAKRHRIKVVTKKVVVDGVQGLRVWRQ